MWLALRVLILVSSRLNGVSILGFLLLRGTSFVSTRLSRLRPPRVTRVVLRIVKFLLILLRVVRVLVLIALVRLLLIWAIVRSRLLLTRVVLRTRPLLLSIIWNVESLRMPFLLASPSSRLLGSLLGKRTSLLFTKRKRRQVGIVVVRLRLFRRHRTLFMWVRMFVPLILVVLLVLMIWLLVRLFVFRFRLLMEKRLLVRWVVLIRRTRAIRL